MFTHRTFFQLFITCIGLVCVTILLSLPASAQDLKSVTYVANPTSSASYILPPSDVSFRAHSYSRFENTFALNQISKLSNSVSYPPCGYPARWVVRNQLPIPAEAVGVANNADSIYAIGGYSFQTSSDINQTLRYDLNTNSWTTLTPVPHVVTLASVIYSSLNNKLYVFGGQDLDGSDIYSSTLIYDPGLNSWSTGASMPGVRTSMAKGYYNGKVYLVGGFNTKDTSSAQAQTWEYDVLTDTWMSKASIPEAFGGAGSGVVDGRLYVFGGSDPVSVARVQTYEYDIALDKWSAKANMPYAANVPGAAVLGDKIWVIGGGIPYMQLGIFTPSLPLNSPVALGTTLIYDPGTDSWNNGPVLSVPRSFIGAAGYKNIAIAIGGYYDNSVGTVGTTEVMGLCQAYLPGLLK